MAPTVAGSMIFIELESFSTIAFPGSPYQSPLGSFVYLNEAPQAAGILRTMLRAPRYRRTRNPSFTVGFALLGLALLAGATACQKRISTNSIRTVDTAVSSAIGGKRSV